MEPSLIDLYNFIKDYNKLDEEERKLFEIKDFMVIYDYLYDIPSVSCENLLNNIKSFKTETETEIEKEPKKEFYLGGQLKLNVNDRITEKEINFVQKKYDNIDYSQLWGEEASSTGQHSERFKKFKKIYNSYIKIK